MIKTCRSSRRNGNHGVMQQCNQVFSERLDVLLKESIPIQSLLREEVLLDICNEFSRNIDVHVPSVVVLPEDLNRVGDDHFLEFVEQDGFMLLGYV